MRLTTRPARYAAAVAAVGVVLTGCSSEAGNQAAQQSDNKPEVVEDVDFEAGTTMAEIADAGTITIGTKYDQPGFGLLNPSGVPQGFDVEIARSSPPSWAWTRARSSSWRPSRPTGSRSSRTARSTWSSRPTRSTTPARRRSTSPARTTRPARTSWSPPSTPRASRAPTTWRARTSARSRARPRRRTSGTTTPRPR